MDPSLIPGVIAAASAAVALFDQVADQVARFINNRPDPTGPKQWRYKIQGEDGEIVVRQEGREIQRITGNDLKDLPNNYYQHIKAFEESMDTKHRLWARIYPKRNNSPDELKNAQTEEQIRGLILDMKKDLVGIVSFLQSIGVHLDDHYMMVRHLVEEYDGKPGNA